MGAEERQRARLAALVDPAITELQQLIGQADSDSVRLSAIKDILDRTGYKPTEKIQSTGDSTIRVEYADTPLTPQKIQELMLKNALRANGHSHDQTP
jgi:hypothetical protein